MTIGRMKAQFERVEKTEDGLSLVFHINERQEEEAMELVRTLRKRTALQDDAVLLDVLTSYAGNQMNRNRFLWVLLEILADARNLKKSEMITARDCFAELMDTYGVEGVLVECRYEELTRLQNIFPALHREEIREYNGVNRVRCKVFPQIAALEDAKLSCLIDGVFDELILLGAIHDEDVQYLYNAWYGKTQC